MVSIQFDNSNCPIDLGHGFSGTKYQAKVSIRMGYVSVDTLKKVMKPAQLMLTNYMSWSLN